MIKSIITNINLLKRPCDSVQSNEDVSQIITDLKDTLAFKRGWGLSANQIGYNKKVSYIKVPKKMNQQTKKIEFSEFVIINPVMTEKDNKVIVQNEECLSFPGIKITTDRYAFITIDYENEQREKLTGLFRDYEALAIQHEYDHLNGLTIFNRKHRAK